MKRKRLESTTLSNKILCLQNGSNVEVQLDDGKWFVFIFIDKNSFLVFLGIRELLFNVNQDDILYR
jgi:hypothetical protein